MLRVQDALRTAIRAGKFLSTRLPTEDQLRRDFGASRSAVRRALELLRDEGIIDRIPGVGTFSSSVVVSNRFDALGGLAGGVPEGQRRVQHMVLNVIEVPAPDAVATRLRLAPRKSAVCVERLSLLDGAPQALSLRYVDADIAQDLLERDLAQDWYDLIEDMFGRQICHADVEVSAGLAGSVDARLLRVDLGSPLLRMTRTLFDESGAPLECSTTTCPGDRTSLSITVPRRGVDAETTAAQPVLPCLHTSEADRS